jgi:hypothetical protein
MYLLFRVEIRHDVILSPELAGVKLARRLCFACEAEPAVMTFTSRVLLFPRKRDQRLHGPRDVAVCALCLAILEAKPHALGLTTMQAR